MFRPLPKRKIKVRIKGNLNKVKGIFLSPIQFEVRVIDGNWLPYMSVFEPQRYGQWETNSCWLLSSVNSYEMQLKYLWITGQFSDEAKTFFLTNGYCDNHGNFTLSERFHEILCGNRDRGGAAEEAWQSFYSKGHIPRPTLSYSLGRSSMWQTQSDFNQDYFDTDEVTQEMKDLGQKFRTYVNSAYQRIGKEFITPDRGILLQAIKQSPLSLGVSIPVQGYQWNNTVVQYDGGKVLAHEITGYHFESDGKIDICDQYNPFLKVLSSDYWLGSVIQGIVSAVKPASVNPIQQDTKSNSWWTAIMNWWNGIFSSTQVGVV